MPPLQIVYERPRRDGVRHTAWLIAGRIRSQFRSFVEDAWRGISTAREVDWLTRTAEFPYSDGNVAIYYVNSV